MNFEFDDFIHIREKFDDDWWIGRVISHDPNMGFIPSPVKIEKIRHSKKSKRNGKMDFEARAERTKIIWSDFHQKCPVIPELGLYNAETVEKGRKSKNAI